MFFVACSEKCIVLFIDIRININNVCRNFVNSRQICRQEERAQVGCGEVNSSLSDADGESDAIE